MMKIEEIEDRIKQWEFMLSKKQKRYIHFNSMRNFVFHFSELPSNFVRDKVISYIEGYLVEVESKYFQFSNFESYDLAVNYIDKISEYYKDFCGFRSIITWNIVVGIGILSDSLLWVSGLAKNYYNIPITFTTLFFYHIFIKIFYGRKKRIYGLFY